MSTNTDEFKAKDFIINPELDAIIPKLNDEKFAALKADIKSRGLKDPIKIMVDKTIVDGHNRYRACKELGIKDYAIDFNVLPKICTIQEAKEYSIEVNFFRRQMITYVAGTWAVNVFDKADKEIADKVGLDMTTIRKVRSLNNKLKMANAIIPEKVSKWLKELSSGDIGFREVLSILTEAENISNLIAIVDDKKFKKELEDTFKTAKYEKKFTLKDSTASSNEVSCCKCKGTGLVKASKAKSETTFKALQKMIDQHDHPELYKPIEDSPYAIAAQKVSDVVDPLAVKFPEQVKVFMVTTESGFLECGDYIKAQAGSGKLYAIVTMLELPKELVNYDE